MFHYDKNTSALLETAGLGIELSQLQAETKALESKVSNLEEAKNQLLSNDQENLNFQ